MLLPPFLSVCTRHFWRLPPVWHSTSMARYESGSIWFNAVTLKTHTVNYCHHVSKCSLTTWMAFSLTQGPCFFENHTGDVENPVWILLPVWYPQSSEMAASGFYWSSKEVRLTLFLKLLSSQRIVQPIRRVLCIALWRFLLFMEKSHKKWRVDLEDPFTPFML
jgi:hypothetical protein